MSDTGSREINDYLRHLSFQGLSTRTIYDRRTGMARFCRYLGDTAPLAATRDHVYDWRAGLAVGPDAIVNYVSQVHCFYAWALDGGLIDANPADGIPVPRLAERMPRPIAEAALTDVLAAACRRVRPWLVLGAWCGLRCCEIAGLRRENIHLDGVPPWLLVTRETAKGGRERVVQLCDFAAAELAACHFGRRGWAFPRRDGRDGHVTAHRVSALCCELLHDCGYPDTMHALRHRFLTQVQQAQGDLRITQQLAGHATPASTAKYTLVSDVRAYEAVQAIPVPRPRRLRTAG